MNYCPSCNSTNSCLCFVPIKPLLLPMPSGLATTPSRCHHVAKREVAEDRRVNCVLLHGSLRDLRCPECLGTCAWDECDREAETLAGQEPPCPRCIDISDARTVKGFPATSIGPLRPDILLYDEQNRTLPWADMVSAIVRPDVLLRLDILLIMGTSLGTHGVKRLVKDFAKAGSFTNGLEKWYSRTSQNQLRAGTA